MTPRVQRMEDVERIIGEEPTKDIIRRITEDRGQNNEIRQIYIIEYSTQAPTSALPVRYRSLTDTLDQASDIPPSYREQGTPTLLISILYKILTIFSFLLLQLAT